MRTATEVFEDHLAKRLAGQLSEDIAENYAPNVIILAGSGAFTGYGGVRRAAAELQDRLGEAVFLYNRTFVRDKYAFLEWTARAADGRTVCDGADSFVIEDGRIVFQSIHYSVQ